MKTALFANITISAKEDVAKAIEIYKSFVPANEDERKRAISALLEIIEEGNADIEKRALYEIAKNDDIIKALIPHIDLDERTKAKSALRKNAVHLAVSYPQFKIIEDGKLYVVKEFYKPVTVVNVVNFLVDMAKFNHADGKATKADRENALAKVLNGSNRALQLFCIGAFSYENIADKMPTLAYMSEEENAVFGGTPSKAKAEKQIKALASALNIEGDFRRIHGLALYKKCYTLDQKMTPKTADAVSILQAFITIARYAINGIEMPEMIDKGGVLYAEKAVDLSDNIFTFA